MGEEEATYTVDEKLINLGFGKFQFSMLLYAGMEWIAEAMEMMLLSFVGPAVQSQRGLSSKEDSMITSVVFVGMLIGACSWGIVSDTYRRSQVNFFFFLVLFILLCYKNMSSIRHLTLVIKPHTGTEVKTSDLHLDAMQILY